MDQSIRSSSSSSMSEHCEWLSFNPPPPEIRVDCGLVGWKRDFLIVVGGTANNRQSLASVVLYHFGDDRWTSLPPLNVPRRHCACCIVRDRYLMVCGGNSNANGRFVDLDTVETLDLERLDEGFCLQSTRLPIPVRNLTAVVGPCRDDDNNHDIDAVYLMGGYSSKLEGNKETMGYLDTILEWTKLGCRVIARMPKCLRLPAAFLLLNQQLVLVGGYHPTRKWCQESYACRLPSSSSSSQSPSEAVEWKQLPSLPVAVDSIFAYWNVGNQCHVITNRTYLMLDYGATKWQYEAADHVPGSRGVAIPSAIISYNDDGSMWWYLDHPTSIVGSITMASIQKELDECERVLAQASHAGYWELDLLDKAARADGRIPVLLQQQALLRNIAELEQQKQAFIQQFAQCQRDGDFHECRALGWNIRNVERELKEAYEDLLNIDENNEISNHSPKKRRNSLEMFRRLNSYAPVSPRQSVKEVLPISQLSVSSIDMVFGEDDASPSKPAERRKSSLLLKGLLSLRDLKELAKASDQSTTGGVF